jgi:hypothetical protein
MKFKPWEKEVLPEPLLDELTMTCTCRGCSCQACNGLLWVTLREAIKWDMITKKQALAKVENYKKEKAEKEVAHG